MSTMNRIVGWRKEPASTKQKKWVADMQEMSDYPLDPIDLSVATKGEISDWIDNNAKRAHESADRLNIEDAYGDR